MMEDPICCETQVTTFLLKPQRVFGVEKPRLTVKEKEELEKRLVECLEYPELYDIFDDGIAIDDKIERVNKHLEDLYEQEKLLAKDKEKKEDYEKLEREIKYFLRQKESLEWEYQQKFPTTPTSFMGNSRNELEEQRDYLLSQKENAEEKREGR